jgi:30S ribosomal protein S31
MGKGDKRTRRGKIAVGSHGKTRPKYKKPVHKATVVEEKPVKKTKAKA